MAILIDSTPPERGAFMSLHNVAQDLAMAGAGLAGRLSLPLPRRLPWPQAEDPAPIWYDAASNKNERSR